MTRRCFQRLYLLRPSDETNDIFLYVLAIAARRFGIRLHAYCVLSNHYHLILTDPHARLPAFGQYLDSLVARAVNSTLGRWESFWAPSSYSAVALLTPEDVLEKAAYVLANPVAAGLVRDGRSWPGPWSDPALVGAEPVKVERPRSFFRKNGYLPARADLELTPPPGFDAADFRRLLSSALRGLEGRHATGRRAFLGASRVLAQSPFARPPTGEPRRNRKPRVAGRDKWKRIEALGRLATFLAEYRQAWEAWTAGVRKARFPVGTYGMLAHGVCCAGAG